MNTKLNHESDHNITPITIQPVDDPEIKGLADQDRQEAFSLVVQKYREKLYQHSFHLLKNSEEARDVTQETLIRAFQEPNFFNEDFKMKPWLFRVITNLCYNITRDQRRRGGILKLMARGPTPCQSLALDDLMRQESELRVSKALDTVPDKYQSILKLKYYNDLSYIDISKALGCKMGTVMSRLSRARDKLQQNVELEAALM